MMYDRPTPKQEAENAFAFGVRDATNGRERLESPSEHFLENDDYYIQGYEDARKWWKLKTPLRDRVK